MSEKDTNQNLSLGRDQWREFLREHQRRMEESENSQKIFFKTLDFVQKQAKTLDDSKYGEMIVNQISKSVTENQRNMI